MLAVILQILSILGIILLILLGAVVAVLLLVFFFPVSYEISGRKSTEEITAKVRVNWMFGLLRAGYVYPEPGRLLVKVLFYTLFDSEAGEPDGSETRIQKAHKKQKKKQKPGSKDKNISAGNNIVRIESVEETEHKKTDVEETVGGETDYQEKRSDSGVADPADIGTGSGTKDENQNPEETNQPGESKAKKGSIRERLFAKFEKIKYTIRKIYDKIKNILENISFYRGLLEEEATRELFRHGCFRIGKLWKNVRPRKVKADILFGAASPDATGYVYGIYSMISPRLGKHICVTPDFDRAVLEGRAEISGHITVFTILWNGMCFVLDKRLRLLIRKLKEHGRRDAEQTKKNKKKNNNTQNNDPKNNDAQGTT